MIFALCDMNQESSLQKSSDKKRAYVLFSGGLDSSLAVRMLQEQGVEVTGVYISTGFCVSAQQKRNGRFFENEEKKDVTQLADELGIDLEVIDISGEYISIVTNPRFGWGKNVNPCIDCRIHMLQRTRELMERNGFDFIATGEVVGQRPMSQRMFTQRLIEKESGLEGRLLRPLSAQFHQETIPEKLGWVDRSRLGRVQGRSRKAQMEMAKEYQLKTISTPAGGCCYLTDENFGVRFKDLLYTRKHLLSDESRFVLTHNDMILLSIGRQIKIRDGLKMIAGRNENENNLLEYYKKGRILLETTEESPGPVVLLDIIENERGVAPVRSFEEIWNYSFNTENSALNGLVEFTRGAVTSAELMLVASILARYSDGREREKVEIVARSYKDDLSLFTRFSFDAAPYKNLDMIQKRLITKVNEAEILEL